MPDTITRSMAVFWKPCKSQNEALNNKTKQIYFAEILTSLTAWEQFNIRTSNKIAKQFSDRIKIIFDYDITFC